MNFDVNILPDDVVLLIFSYLSKEDLLHVRDVSVQWRELTKLKTVWKHVVVELQGHNFKAFPPLRGVLKTSVLCLKTASALDGIDFYCLDNWMTDKVGSLILRSNLKSVRWIHFFYSPISWRIWWRILYLLAENLEVLKLTSFPTLSPIVADGTMSSNKCKFPKLKALEIHRDSITQLCSLSIFPWPKLQKLILRVLDLDSPLTDENEFILLSKLTLRKLFMEGTIAEGFEILLNNFRSNLKAELENLEEFGCVCGAHTCLVWQFENFSESLIFYPGFYNTCTKDANSICDDCLLFNVGLNGFELVCEVTIYFRKTSYRCVKSFLKSENAAKIKKLTLHRECECDSDDHRFYLSGFDLAMTALGLRRSLETLCVVGCSRFMNFRWDVFKEMVFTYMKYEFDITIIHEEIPYAL